ncbi:universal stress protein [Rubripirellula reticaptiva]|uniref:Universal stress protein n=1 Tax=Rubripirellula reticaptiva TaxID=2528013 RepID=A0A5C6EF95_9BACT|nr:universal stress protein [Rubripirellula reticaptiva]TWU46697.1 Universal stress protein [Rubripirellula reticaptiva]
MKVLLPIDGSAAASDAVKFVRSLADNQTVDVIVVMVSYDPSKYSFQPWVPEWTVQENARAEATLSKAKQLLAETCNSVLTIHGSGAPIPFLLKQAIDSDVDLIVLGAVGHSAVSRLLLGSVSDTIASQAKCSVVVVRPSDNDTGRPQRLVLAYDRSAASREAVAELMQWNLRGDTKVDVVSVVQNPFIFVGEGYVAEPNMVTPEQIQPVSETAERMASQIADHFHQTQSHVPVADHIGDAIVQAAQKEKAELIIVGDTGHSLLGELFLGSTSKYVLRHAPCSVWISRHHYKSDKSARENDDAVAAS